MRCFPACDFKLRAVRYTRRKIIRFPHLLRVFACAAFAALPAGAHAQWQPTRNVEIVAPAAAGSALDAVARLMQKVLQDKKMLSANLTVVDKAGGGNAVGFNYLNSRPADGHAILVTPFTIITNKITGANPINYQDITPISMLADEHIAFVVNANSPLKTGKDLLERIKRDPTSVSMALAAALGNANHIAMSLVGKAVGADPKRFRIAVFNSSGESITAVLGGHVELAVTTTGLVGGHIQAGRGPSWLSICSLGAWSPNPCQASGRELGHLLATRCPAKREKCLFSGPKRALGN